MSILMVVGQRPFRLQTGDFCKALPLLSDDGVELLSSDFPNDGEIWWMLTPQSAELAQPGRLIKGELEEAHGFRPGDPLNSQHQIVKDSPRSLVIADGLELLEVPSAALSNITDIAISGARLLFDHAPATHVLLKWRDVVYGPFEVHGAEPEGEGWRVSLRASHRNLTVKGVADSEFREKCKAYIRDFTAEVGMSEHHRREQQLKLFRYTFLLGAGHHVFLGCAGETIDMELLDQKLLRLSKKLLTRGQRQELTRLLNTLFPLVEKAEDPDKLRDVLSRVGQIQKQHEDALNRVCDALVQSGALGSERIEDAQKRFVDEYISKHAAEIQAVIQSKISDLQKQEAGLVQELQNRRTVETAALQRDLQHYRDKTHAELSAREEKVKYDETRLNTERDVLQKHLEQAAQTLSQSGEKVVNNFMTMMPFLQRTGLLQPGLRGGVIATDVPQETTRPAQWELPFYVTAPRTVDKNLTEQEFFKRFTTVVDNSGYQYAFLDLARYHLSVKCSELTIIGGPSGIGKTSLALLYARALKGGDQDNARRDTLVVNVNPAWMEVRDILGHMNTLERRFCPSETGLYEYLICAQEEHRQHQEGSPLYPVCFDEMNLAQVEHYFSDFLQLMEMPLEVRLLSCFNPSAAGNTCAYRNWSQLKLPPSLRFVGTVNFDETTRRLSDRLLDRANLIALRAGQIPSTLKGGGVLATCEGSRVTLGNYQTWVREAALPSGLAKLLDDCRRPLAGMGVPLSARAYRGICRFVASAGSIISVEQAFDIQIAQRVLSRIRNLVTPAQHDALDQLRDILNKSTVCAFDESLALLADIQQFEQRADWQVGDQS